MKLSHLQVLLSATACVVGLLGTTARSEQPCEILVVDDSNDWPVPLVELTTVHHVSFVTDNAGLIAFDLPELMNQEVWFAVQGHGYSVDADGFGYRGVRITPRPGERIVLRVKRALPAKRLGRITGSGLFAESQQVGEQLQWSEQGILGCDSTQVAVHRGELFWGWGDTNLAHYPLGLFHTLGAKTQVQPIAKLVPPIELRFDYFRDANTQRVRNVAEFPGTGPTWLSGYASLPDRSGRPRLVATYSKITPPLEVYEKGLCVWDEKTESFEPHTRLWSKGNTRLPATEFSQELAVPEGHAVHWRDEAGQEWLLFGDPFPTLRCKATFESWSNPDEWEQVAAPDPIISPSDGQVIKPHRGSIAWNGYRNKWIAIFTQLGGKSSFLGEIWYVESDSPFGPWGEATHVVTHNQYSFYNPLIHAEFVHADSPMVIFEGTYTKTFSKAPVATARYEYNQILYRLDLDELSMTDADPSASNVFDPSCAVAEGISLDAQALQHRDE